MINNFKRIFYFFNKKENIYFIKKFFLDYLDFKLLD